MAWPAGKSVCASLHCRGGDVEEGFHVCSQLGQHRLEVEGEQAEQVEADAASFMQLGFHAFLLGQFPRLVVVHILVGEIGQAHDVAQGLAVFASFILGGDILGGALQLLRQGPSRPCRQACRRSAW